jgi:hypothetical protein
LSTGAIGAIVGSISAVFVVALVIGGLIYYYRLRIRVGRVNPTQTVEAADCTGGIQIAENPSGRVRYPDGEAPSCNGEDNDPEKPSGRLRYPDGELLDSGRTVWQ